MTRRTHGRRAAAVLSPLAALLGLAACGASTTTTVTQTVTQTVTAGSAAGSSTTADTGTQTTTAAAIDACKLVTIDDAKKLTGTDLQPGVEGGATPSCTYTAPPTGTTAQVSVFVGDGAKKILDIDRTLGHTFETVTGIGDEAYVENDGAFVRKGTTWVAIQLVLLNDPAANHDPLVQLLRTAASRL